MRPFSKKDQLGYVLGDMAGSFVNLYVDGFFLLFCTTVLGINPVHMGTLFIVARLWDAINDPLIGSLPDRFKLGKSGDKFKPYIKIAMIPLAISGVLCFMDVSGLAYNQKMIYVSIVYILYGMSYTATSMPFGAMATVITEDSVERAKLSRARAIGGTLVGIGALSIVPLLTFDSVGNVIPSGFRNLAIIFGILSVVCYTLLMKLTVERVKQPVSKGEKFNYIKVLKGVLKNRPLIGVMVATVGSLIFITGTGQLTNYLFKEYYQAPHLLSLNSFLSLPIMVVAFILIPKLTKKYGNKKVLVSTISLNLVVSTLLFVTPIENPVVYLLINVLGNFGQTCFMMLIWALVTDCIDYQEYITGERADGSLYSIYTFSRKIGSTIASGLASYSLAWVGFVSGVEFQTPEVASNIRTLVTAVPILVCTLELVGIGLIFNLTNDKIKEVNDFIRKNRANA